MRTKRETEPWETCPLTRLIFFFLGADLMMMLVRVIEAFGPRMEARR